MNDSKKSLLQQAFEYADSSSLRVRSYSGRGMYGKDCLGVTVKRGHQADVTRAILEFVADHDEPGEAAETLADEVDSWSEDSMGLDGITYFPRVPFVGEEEDDEEEESDDEG